MTPPPADDPSLTGEALHARLAALSDVLRAARPLWSTRPFRARRMPWEDDHPDLARWLRALPRDRVFALEGDPQAADAPGPWPELAAAVAPLTRIGPLPAGPPLDARHPLARRVRGRKWDQVRGFLAVVEAGGVAPGPVVEWCSGRGNLGRTLARRLDRPALLLERDPDLCHPPGDAPEDDRVRHVCVDVRAPEAEQAIAPDGTLVALHACGTLTDRALDVAARRSATAVVAPCCLHRLIGVDRYAPRSAVGRARDLELEREDLRVATREACHAGARRTRLRARELVLRSAWDLLLREATGRDVHHALPTMVRSVFDLPLAEFLGRMAENERVDLPAFDPAALERAAVERVHEIRVLELPRLLFRRALELWVDLDRAASLDELGWTTALGTFCDAAASPRNLAIHASRPNRIGSGALHSFTSVHEQDRPPPAMLRT